MYIKNQWYLACLLEELNHQNPLKKKICGEEIVVFKTASGKVGVMEDRCCHRNVNLSLGYVQGENIKCGYHGWEYSCEGKCVLIPSLPNDERIPASAKVKKYVVEVKHKCVWVWIGEEEKADTSLIPPMHEMDTYPIVYNYHFIDADLQLVAESLFDAYHINHVHRNSIKGMMGALKDERMEFNVQIDGNSLTGKYLLENVIISDDSLPQAPVSNPDLTILSKSGTFVRRKFSLSGGSVGLFEGKKIGRKKNLEILEVDIKKVETTENQLNKQLATLRSHLQSLKNADQSVPLQREREALNRLSQDKAGMQAKLDNIAAFVANFELAFVKS